MGRLTHGEPDVVVGRERELATVERVVRATEGGSLVLVGGPGIGKTTLWEAGVAAAREAGARILSARPSDAEASLAFAGLIDLFDGVRSDELADLPAPQLEALEVPLLRTTRTGSTPEPAAIGVGLLTALRTLAASRPIVVAIDDLQWLDPASAEERSGRRDCHRLGRHGRERLRQLHDHRIRLGHLRERRLLATRQP